MAKTSLPDRRLFTARFCSVFKFTVRRESSENRAIASLNKLSIQAAMFVSRDVLHLVFIKHFDTFQAELTNQYFPFRI